MVELETSRKSLWDCLYVTRVRGYVNRRSWSLVLLTEDNDGVSKRLVRRVELGVTCARFLSRLFVKMKIPYLLLITSKFFLSAFWMCYIWFQRIYRSELYTKTLSLAFFVIGWNYWPCEERLNCWSMFSGVRKRKREKEKGRVKRHIVHKGSVSRSNLNEWEGARAFPFVSNKTLLPNDLSALPV